MRTRNTIITFFLVLAVFVGGYYFLHSPSGAVSDSSRLSEIYKNNVRGFSVRYPSGYTLDTSYRYQALGPGKGISGVKFTIPTSIPEGTNLAPDTYMSVEEIPKAATCTAKLFLDDSGAIARAVTDGGTNYSVASSTGAGAGNRYEETVYAISGTNPCIAVRYFVHYGVIENYTPGAVREFNRRALLKEFDSIRRTLVIAHQ